MSSLRLTGPPETNPTLALLVDHDRNRDLLADWLADAYDVTTGVDTLDDTTDLCLVDEAGFASHQSRLREWKETARPVFAPVLLLSEDPPGESFDPQAWQTIDGLHIVDDIVSVPIEQAVLQRRLSNLLERRRLSRQLDAQYRRSEERFTSLFHATPDPALVVDEDGTISFVNDALCTITDNDRSELVGDRLSAVAAFPEEIADAIHETTASAVAGTWDGPTTVDYEMADGTRRWFELNASPLSVDDVSGAVVVLRDVTERRERQRAVEAQNERLEEFAGIVSHDLRNPLQVALSRLQILKEETDTGDNVEALEDAVQRMDQMVDDLFALARRGDAAIDSEPVVISTLAQQAWDSIDATDATLDVETNISIYGDSGRLTQLFENVFRNALQHGTNADLLGTDGSDDNAFTDGTTALTVRVGELDDGFYIEDDGSGIPEGERDDVLEVGYTTSADGTGLGLDIVSDIVAAHDWTITVTESDAGGARFEITDVKTF